MGEEIFIDANIFLEIFLKDPKAENCKKTLKLMQESNKQAVTTDFIVYTCFITISNNLKETRFVKNALIFFNFYNNLKISRPSFDDMYYATEIMEKTKLDFDDSLVVACMENNKIKKIASLDRHFDKVKSIERIKL